MLVALLTADAARLGCLCTTLGERGSLLSIDCAGLHARCAFRCRPARLQGRSNLGRRPSPSQSSVGGRRVRPVQPVAGTGVLGPVQGGGDRDRAMETPAGIIGHQPLNPPMTPPALGPHVGATHGVNMGCDALVQPRSRRSVRPTRWGWTPVPPIHTHRFAPATAAGPDQGQRRYPERRRTSPDHTRPCPPTCAVEDRLAPAAAALSARRRTAHCCVGVPTPLGPALPPWPHTSPNQPRGRHRPASSRASGTWPRRWRP